MGVQITGSNGETLPRAESDEFNLLSFLAQWLPEVFSLKSLKLLARLLPKAICILDDIPFLIMQHAGSIGVYLLVAAGFLIFPIQMGLSIRKLRARKNRAANAATIAFSATGLAVTGALLAFAIVAFPIFAAAASIAIPSIMSVIGFIELLESAAGLHKAKVNAENLSGLEYKMAVTNAARGVVFSSTFMFFSLAITALAVLGVLSGLGVVSLGLIPSMVLIGVVVASLALKIFEIADNRIGKNDGNNHRATNAIHRVWLRVTGQRQYLAELKDDPRAHRNIFKVLDDSAGSRSAQPNLHSVPAKVTMLPDNTSVAVEVATQPEEFFKSTTDAPVTQTVHLPAASKFQTRLV